jgi:hypothetical protein
MIHFAIDLAKLARTWPQDKGGIAALAPQQSTRRGAGKTGGFSGA